MVPYLDIMVNLIMFMIVVTAYVIELRQAPVVAPSYGSPGGNDESNPKPYLTVALSTKSIAILGSAGDVPAMELVKQGGRYPYAELTQALRSYKTQYEIAENLVVTADATVPYSVLVAAMDASREDTEGLLFPTVTLGLAVGGR